MTVHIHARAWCGVYTHRRMCVPGCQAGVCTHRQVGAFVGTCVGVYILGQVDDHCRCLPVTVGDKLCGTWNRAKRQLWPAPALAQRLLLLILCPGRVPLQEASLRVSRPKLEGSSQLTLPEPTTSLDTVKVRQDLLSVDLGQGRSSPCCRKGPSAPEVGTKARDPAFVCVRSVHRGPPAWASRGGGGPGIPRETPYQEGFCDPSSGLKAQRKEEKLCLRE